MPAYTAPPMRRYLGAMKDPNSPSGSNLDTIQGNAAFGITADTVNFPSGLIPDVTNVWPVKTAALAWNEQDIDLSDLVTGNRAGPAPLPFKVLPTFTFQADAHRYILEAIMAACMGQIGSVTAATFEVDTIGLGAASAGTFQYSFVWNGLTYTTQTATAYNAANAVLQANLRAAIGPQGQTLPAAAITVSGGPLPAVATITYSGGMAGPVTGQAVTPVAPLTGGTVALVRVTPGTAYVHPISAKPFGQAQLPTYIFQLLEDAVNRKLTGCAIESFDIVMPHDGVGTISVEAYPLYVSHIDDSGSPTVPTGVNPEPNTLPMLARDLTINFDNGTAEAGLAEFRFGWKNNATYDRAVLGSCIENRVLNGSTYKLWHRNYHRITGRQTVSWGFRLLDSSVKHELAMQWTQVRKVVANLVDPSGGSDAIQVTLPRTTTDSGGAPALAATGDLSSDFTGRAFYDTLSGTDATVAVTNNSAGGL